MIDVARTRSAAPAGPPSRLIPIWTAGQDAAPPVLDAVTHRLYIPVDSAVLVVSADSGASIGAIEVAAGATHLALAPALHKGFISHRQAGTVTALDLRTLRTSRTITAGKGPGPMAFDPLSGTLCVLNTAGKDVTVVSAEHAIARATLTLAASPAGIAAGTSGLVYISLPSTNEILRVDASGLRVETRWTLPPGTAPGDLAFDARTSRLFARCHGGAIAVLDAESGRVVTTIPIAPAPGGLVLDTSADVAITFLENGAAAVFSLGSSGSLGPAHAITAATDARVVALDPVSRRLFYLGAGPAAGRDGGYQVRMVDAPFLPVHAASVSDPSSR